jgi:hypothetical protein
MAFNLGQTRLSRFVKLIDAVNTSNGFAASEMKNSLWARQVGRRAVSNIWNENNCLRNVINIIIL